MQRLKNVRKVYSAAESALFMPAAHSSKSAPAPPDRDASAPSFRPRQKLLFDQDPRPIDFDSLSKKTVLFAFGKQDAKWPIGIHYVVGAGHPNGHFASIALGDRVQLFRIVEDLECPHPNPQSKTDTDSLEIDNAPGLVRTLLVGEPTLSP